VRPPERLSPVDLSLWDAAVALAQPSRGLCLEAMAQSTPLGFDGATLWAACPHAALRCELAREGASKACAQAFGVDRLRVEWAAPSGGDPQGISWQARASHAQHLARIEAHQAFLNEPLTQAILGVQGASVPLEGFVAGD
jgi:hypothetical protein